MFKLVKTTKEMMVEELVRSLYKEDLFAEMLVEQEEVAAQQAASRPPPAASPVCLSIRSAPYGRRCVALRLCDSASQVAMRRKHVQTMVVKFRQASSILQKLPADLVSVKID
jgi:hypothetical protein